MNAIGAHKNRKENNTTERVNAENNDMKEEKGLYR